MSKICEKRVHGNGKINLPWAPLGEFAGCSRSLYFTLLIFSVQVKSRACYITDQWGRVQNNIKETLP